MPAIPVVQADHDTAGSRKLAAPAEDDAHVRCACTTCRAPVARQPA